MTVQELETLYDYGYWANRHLLEVASQLDDEDFTRKVAGSFGSVRDTFVHILSAENGWLGCCKGQSRPAPLIREEYPSVESVHSAMGMIETDMREFLASLEPDALERDISFAVSQCETRSLPLGELLHHVANHGSHHRGQVALLLRELGLSPGNFDILFYYSEKHGRPWVWRG